MTCNAHCTVSIIVDRSCMNITYRAVLMDIADRICLNFVSYIVATEHFAVTHVMKLCHPTSLGHKEADAVHDSWYGC